MAHLQNLRIQAGRISRTLASRSLAQAESVVEYVGAATMVAGVFINGYSSSLRDMRKRVDGENPPTE